MAFSPTLATISDSHLISGSWPEYICYLNKVPAMWSFHRQGELLLTVKMTACTEQCFSQQTAGEGSLHRKACDLFISRTFCMVALPCSSFESSPYHWSDSEIHCFFPFIFVLLHKFTVAFLLCTCQHSSNFKTITRQFVWTKQQKHEGMNGCQIFWLWTSVTN